LEIIEIVSCRHFENSFQPSPFFCHGMDGMVVNILQLKIHGAKNHSQRSPYHVLKSRQT
jgi:hypothetical protein